MINEDTDSTYIVESRRPIDGGGWSQWSSDGLGNNVADLTQVEAEAAAADLPRLGGEWAECEYRVREAD